MAFTYSWPGTIADSAIDPDSPIDTALMTAIRNALVFNYEYTGGKSYTPAEPHNHNGSNSAPIAFVPDGSITTSAKFAAGVVNEAAMASAAISTSKLKTTIGNVSTLASNTQSLLTLPGGEYGFYPQVKSSGGAQAATATIGGDTYGWGVPSMVLMSDWGNSYITRIVLGSTDGSTKSAQQRYVSASPPWHSYRADDPVPLFVFALLDKTTGAVVATYVAVDPPWGNNGPTLISPIGRLRVFLRQKLAALDASLDEDDRLDFLYRYLRDRTNAKEIAGVALQQFSQAEKNADMPLIPHPFGTFDPARHIITVLNATDDKAGRALLMRHEFLGDPLSEMLHDGYFTIDNAPLPGLTTPSGVIAVRATLKKSR